MKNESSPNVQLEWLELPTNRTALWTATAAAILFARQDIDTILAKSANAFGTSITRAEEGQPSTCGAVNMHVLTVSGRRVRKTLRGNVEIVAGLVRLDRRLNRRERLHAGLVRWWRRQGVLEWRSMVRMELRRDIGRKRSSVQVMWGLRDLFAVSSAGQANQWRSESCTYRSQIPAVLLCGRSCCINQVLPPLSVHVSSCARGLDREGLSVMAHAPLELLGPVSFMPRPARILGDGALARPRFVRARNGRQSGRTPRRRAGQGRGQQLAWGRSGGIGEVALGHQLRVNGKASFLPVFGLGI